MIKKIYTLLVLLIALTPIVSGNFTVQDSCTLTIDATPIGGFVANATGVAPFTYEWSNGAFDQTLYPNSSGVFCVTITDADGCAAVGCITYTGGGGGIDSCDVSIQTIQGGFCFQATATGELPYTYIWDTGENTDVVCPNAPGTYCVTITDALGCQSTACDFFGDTTSINCGVVIDLTAIGYTAIASGVAPYTYYWSDGSIGNTINPIDDGTYCVTITDADNCIATECFTYIGNNQDSCSVDILIAPNSLCLSTDPPNAISYSWSNGENTDQICPTEDGTYCVTVVDAAGCAASNCIYLEFPNPDSCGVFITTTQTSGGLNLSANPESIGTFEYFWNTGATTEDIVVFDYAIYCVTITEVSTGCVSVDCFIYEEPMLTDCYTWSYNLSGTNNSVVKVNTNLDNTNAALTYQWDTGATSDTIIVSTPGVYCVTVTDANGNACTSCANVGLAYIYGNVITADSTNGYQGTVYLIQYDEVAETLTAIETKDLNDGNFDFYVDMNQTYLLKVALDPSDPLYATHLPTYYQSALFWDEADDVMAGAAQNYFPITMVQGNNPGGPGFIGGLVTEGANFIGTGIGAGSRGGPGDPIANVNVLLLDENENPVAHTLTDDDGEFQFASVAYGTYHVYAEVLGRLRAQYVVTLSPDTPSSTDNDFVVNSANITTSIKEVIKEESLSVFPNPANTNINLKFNAAESLDVNVVIQSVNGQTILQRNTTLANGWQTISFDIEALPSGMYFINVINGKVVLSHKFVKK